MILGYKLGTRMVQVEIEAVEGYDLPCETDLGIVLRPIFRREFRRGADALDRAALATHLVSCLALIGNGGRTRIVSLTVLSGLP